MQNAVSSFVESLNIPESHTYIVSSVSAAIQSPGNMGSGIHAETAA